MNPNVPLDIDALRHETPGCVDLAFLNNAGASLPTQRTLDAVIGHLVLESQVGGYRAAAMVSDRLVAARAGLASLIGGSRSEVALTISDSAGWVKAIWGWMLGGNVAPGQLVLVDRLTYHSHYAALVQLASMFRFEMSLLGSLDDGTIDVDALAVALIDDRLALVCVTAIGTHSGNVNPVEAVGRAAKTRGVPMFVDGCQALAHLEVDVRAWGASVFTGTGRKWLRAPRGTGMVWIAGEIVDRFSPPGIDAETTKRDGVAGLTMIAGMARFEEFEAPIAAQVGLASAVEQTLELSMRNIEARISALASVLRLGLSQNDRVHVHDTAQQRCGIVTFTVDGRSPAEVVEAAARRNVSINVSTANWAGLDMHAKGLTQVVRVSPHIYNTEAELALVIDSIA